MSSETCLATTLYLRAKMLTTQFTIVKGTIVKVCLTCLIERQKVCWNVDINFREPTVDETRGGE